MNWLLGTKRAKRMRSGWDPDMPLLEWTKGAPWSIRNSFEGTQIWGSTGSGKSSGSLALICRSMLRAGYGGIFFTTKREDRATYERYIRDTGRLDDLLIFSPDHALRYDFIKSEIEQCSDAVGLAENLTALIMTVAQLGEGGGGSRGGGSENAEYFRQATLRLCRNAMLILVLSGKQVSVPTLHQLVVTAPRSREQSQSEGWQRGSFFFQCLDAASRSRMTASQRADFELALVFFMEEWSELNSRTRSTVESTLTSATDALSRGAVRDMISSPQANFSPSMLYEGALVIAEFPVLVYRDIGRLIQVVLKFCCQRCHGRRDVSRNPRPTFIVADECHLLIVDADQAFQTTARSSNTAVVYATQSLSTYLEAMGPHSEAKVHSMLGNLQTLVNHQQSDTQTIRYVQELVGRSRQYAVSGNTPRGGDWLAPLFGKSDGGSFGFSEHFEYELQSADLNGLAKGGPPHWYSEAIVYQGGRRFPNGRTWCRVAIPQKR